MKKYTALFSLVLFLAANAILSAQGATGETVAPPEQGIDWFQLIVSASYLAGVFILLPLVVYTNLKEKLFNSESADNAPESLVKLTEEQRNQRTAEILDKIEKQLTPFKTDEGEELVTITNAKQAKFVKYGLDYINMRLQPTDENLVARVEEFSEVYRDRARRAFTGSKWIIGCSAGVGIFMLYMAGFSTFIIIHFLGLLFYILASRTTFYGIEKRMKLIGDGTGVVGGIMSGLFLGNGVKYYVREGHGPWKRDYETELSMGMVGLLFMFVIAMFLGFLAVVMAVINTVLNYSTSMLLPTFTADKWYEKNFETMPQVS